MTVAASLAPSSAGARGAARPLPKRLTRLPDVVATRRGVLVVEGKVLHRSWRATVFARRPMARAGAVAALWSETDCKALRYDPFEGEDVRRRTLRDGIVVSRQAHHCVICWALIPAGSRVRSTTEIVSDGGKPWVGTTYTCPICVDAEAENWEDGGEAICARSSIGVARSMAGEVFPPHDAEVRR